MAEKGICSLLASWDITLSLGVDVKVRYITNIKEKKEGGIIDLCDHPSNATPIKEGVGGKEPRDLAGWPLGSFPADTCANKVILIIEG